MVPIVTNGVVNEKGILTIQLPSTSIQPGCYNLVIVIETSQGIKPKKKLNLTTYPVGLSNLSNTFRRENLYDDFGR